MGVTLDKGARGGPAVVLAMLVAVNASEMMDSSINTLRAPFAANGCTES